MHVILSNILNKKFNSNSTQCRKVQISSLAQFPCAQNFPELSTLFCRATDPFIIPRFLKILKQMQAIFCCHRSPLICKLVSYSPLWLKWLPFLQLQLHPLLPNYQKGAPTRLLKLRWCKLIQRVFADILTLNSLVCTMLT